jgi:hypothetical protein
MEADELEVPWVVGLTRTREGGVKERATTAVSKPREEGMGRGGPTQLMLREGGGGSDARGVEEDGARRPELHEHGGGGCQSGTCRVKQGKS